MLNALLYRVFCTFLRCDLLAYLEFTVSFFCLQLHDCFVFSGCLAAGLDFAEFLLVSGCLELPEFLLPALSANLSLLRFTSSAISRGSFDFMSTQLVLVDSTCFCRGFFPLIFLNALHSSLSIRPPVSIRLLLRLLFKLTHLE